ncbi:MAG: YdeI/OmpD-associated family protein [Chloroflexota bacterium]|nr:YdeI/OmpD-associated family protein [Chloroflexota bacterium]
MRFRTTILQSGKTATGIQVPDEVMAALGPSRRAPIRVTLNGYTYRTTVGSVDGRPMFGVSADVRKNATVAGGDQVDVDIELDTEPREVTVPADLQAVLSGDPEAGRFFERLSHSHKSAYVVWIESARKAETRERRILEAVRMLKEGRKQR